MFRKLLAGASTLVVGATLSLLAVAAPADAAGVNPLDPAHGFTVLTQGDAVMSAGSETEGSWAVGGDLTVSSRYDLLANHHGSALPTFSGVGVQLLTGGKVVFGVGGEALDLNAGALRVGDTTGYTTSGARFSTQADTSAYVRMHSSDSLSTITSTLYADTFGSAFGTLAASAARIHALEASDATVLTLIDPANGTPISGNDKGLRLTSGTINVLHVTAAQLSAIANIKFLDGVMPSASTPLYIDITDAGSIDVGIPDVLNADARYVLYNVASATSATVHGPDKIDGAILAPGAAVRLTGATYEGQIVAKSFTTSSAREIHNILFGGTIPPPSTPTPKDAAAAVTVTPATCDAPQTLTLPTPTFATWGMPTLTTGPGAYSVVATAVDGHQFADGSTTQTFTGTLSGVLTTGCGPQTVTLTVAPSYTPATCGADGALVLPSQPHIVWTGGADGDGAGSYTITAHVDDPTKYTLDAAVSTWTVVVPARGLNADGSGMNCAADCLKASAVSYTYDPTTNSGVITVTPTKYSDTLCNGFWVTATAWKYTSTGVWPQKLDGYKEANGGTEITTAGSYPYGIQPSCGQGDIYASFGSPVPTPTAVLNGPNTPYTEHFLHDMGFSGPTPTYVQQPTGSCNVIHRDAVAPSVTQITACGTLGSISWTDQPGEVTYALTKGNGSTGLNEVTATAVSPWVFDDDTTVHVYAIDLGAYTDCVKPVVTSSVGACTANGSDPSTETVTFTFDNTGSTRAVVFAVPSESISVSVAAGATTTATALAPEGGASYEVTADGAHLSTVAVPAFAGCRTSVAGDPSASPATCSAGAQQPGSITVDFKPGLVYTITDASGASATATQATTPEAPGDYTVSVAAVAPYVLTLEHPASWPYSLTVLPAASCGVVPEAPSAADQATCDAGSYTLPADADVVWDVTTTYTGLLPGVEHDKAAGTYGVSTATAEATVVVTATPAPGVQFAPGATTSWTFTFTQPDGGCLPTLADFTIEWTSAPAVCGATGTAPAGTITVGPADFLSEVAYFIDGARVTSPTTIVSAGTHVLTAAPIDPADTVDNPGPHTIDIAAATTVCPTELKTLALTGTDPTAWIVGALAMLVLGLGLLTARLLRRRPGRHAA